MFRRISILTSCALLLAACGGGGGGTASSTPQPVPTPTQPDPAPTPAEPAFALTASTPADGATAVDRNTTFGASFNRAVASASVTGSSARLLGPEGNAIPVALSVSGSDIGLAAPLGLPGNTTYRVELAASLADAKGNTLGNAVSRTFTTAAQSWQPTASELGSLTSSTANTAPMVQADRDGNVMVVWKHAPAGLDTIYASRLEAKTGTWSAPATVAVTDASGNFGAVSMTAGAKGDIYVTFTESHPGTQAVKMQRYDPGSGNWSALPAVTAPVNGVTAHLITDAAGNLTAIVNNFGIYAYRFDTATQAWAAPVRLDSPDRPATYAMNVTAAADGKGGLLVGWLQDTPDGRAVVVTRNDGANWSTPQELDHNVNTLSAANFPIFSLAVNDSGNAIVSWTHNNGMVVGPTVMASIYQSASGTWSTATRLDQADPALGASNPQAVIDAAGVPTVLWWQNEGMFARRYSATTGTWSAQQRAGDAGDQFVAVVDPAGNVMVVQEQDQAQSIHAIQYLLSDGQWHDSTISQPAAGSTVFVNTPVVTIDAGGTVTAAWFAWNNVGGMPRMPVSVNRFK
jgi:hypothetical protein